MRRLCFVTHLGFLLGVADGCSDIFKGTVRNKKGEGKVSTFKIYMYRVFQQFGAKV